MSQFDAIGSATGGVLPRATLPQGEGQRAAWLLEMEKALLAANRVKVTPQAGGPTAPAHDEANPPSDPTREKSLSGAASAPAGSAILVQAGSALPPEKPVDSANYSATSASASATASGQATLPQGRVSGQTAHGATDRVAQPLAAPGAASPQPGGRTAGQHANLPDTGSASVTADAPGAATARSTPASAFSRATPGGSLDNHALALSAYQSGAGSTTGPITNAISIAISNATASNITSTAITPGGTQRVLPEAQPRPGLAEPAGSLAGSEHESAGEAVTSIGLDRPGLDRSKRVLSEPWQQREFHLYQGADGVQAWIRDAELNPAQIFAVAQGLKSELQQTGLKLKQLTVNGKPFTAYDGLVWPGDGAVASLTESDQ
jgi:hypothetical protein